MASIPEPPVTTGDSTPRASPKTQRLKALVSGPGRSAWQPCKEPVEDTDARPSFDGRPTFDAASTLDARTTLDTVAFASEQPLVSCRSTLQEDWATLTATGRMLEDGMNEILEEEFDQLICDGQGGAGLGGSAVDPNQAAQPPSVLQQAVAEAPDPTEDILPISLAITGDDGGLDDSDVEDSDFTLSSLRAGELGDWPGDTDEYIAQRVVTFVPALSATIPRRLSGAAAVAPPAAPAAPAALFPSPVHDVEPRSWRRFGPERRRRGAVPYVVPTRSATATTASSITSSVTDLSTWEEHVASPRSSSMERSGLMASDHTSAPLAGNAGVALRQLQHRRSRPSTAPAVVRPVGPASQTRRPRRAATHPREHREPQ